MSPKLKAENAFVDDYIASAKRCCTDCYQRAINSRAWVARAFTEGWNACTKEILKKCEDKIASPIESGKEIK